MPTTGLLGLSGAEREVVCQCLRAAVDGPFFPDFEFLALLGTERAELSALLDLWPRLDDTDGHIHALINNAILNLLCYPHQCEADWPKHIEVPVEEVGRIYAKWRGVRPKDYLDAKDYFDAME